MKQKIKPGGDSRFFVILGDKDHKKQGVIARHHNPDRDFPTEWRGEMEDLPNGRIANAVVELMTQSGWTIQYVDVAKQCKHCKVEVNVLGGGLITGEVCGMCGETFCHNCYERYPLGPGDCLRHQPKVLQLHLYHIQQDCEKVHGRYLADAIVAAPYVPDFDKKTEVLFGGKKESYNAVMNEFLSCSEFCFTDHKPCVIRLMYLSIERVGVALETVNPGVLSISFGEDGKKDSPSDTQAIVNAMRKRTGNKPIKFPK